MLRYQDLSRSPLSRWRFARLTSERTPLVATLQAQCEELRPGLCRLSLAAHRRVRTAQGSIDSSAISALAQLTAAMLLDVSLPERLTAHVRGLTIEHLRDSDSGVIALARLDKEDWSQTATIGVPVTLSDAGGTEVARAVVSFRVARQDD